MNGSTTCNENEPAEPRFDNPNQSNEYAGVEISRPDRMRAQVILV